MFLHVTDDLRSIESAHLHELRMVESLIEQIKNPAIRKFRTDLSWIMSSAMQRAARGHREMLVREFGEPEQLNSDIVKRIFCELDEVVSGPTHIASESLEMVRGLLSAGLATETDLACALSLPIVDSRGLKAADFFAKAMAICNRAVWFDEERESPPEYPALIEMLAANSMGAFRPETILQSDVRSIRMPRFDSPDDSFVLVQFIHGQRLFRGALKDQRDWTDTDALLEFVNAPFEVNDSGRRFYAVDTENGGACFCFGELSEIKSIAAKFNVRIKTPTAAKMAFTTSLPPLDEFVLQNRWDGLCELFEECDIDTPSHQLVHMRNQFGQTLLHLCDRPNIEIGDVQLILDAGADVNARDTDGNTPLHLCDERFIDTLLEAGASHSLHNHQGRTVLHSLADGGEAVKLENLLRACPGLDINQRTIEPDPEWRSPFERFIPSLPRNERQLRSGQTALHRAAFHGRNVVYQLLLQHGADRSIRDSGGFTPDDLL